MLATGRIPRRKIEEFFESSDLRAFGEDQCILYIDAEISDSALQPVTKQDLYGAQIASLLIDDGRLGSAQRMCPVVLLAQPNSGDPLVNETSILTGADVIAMIDPARKDEVVERASSAFEPSENAAAGRFQEFELNGPTGLLLNNNRSSANPAAADKLADQEN
jgi:hypothetical protein